MKLLSQIFLTLGLVALCALPVTAQLAAAASAKPLQEAANPTDPVANELAQLRKSLQTLNTRLQTIAEELIATDSKASDSEKIKQIAGNMDLLAQTEQRAEVLHKQLIELIEKETAYRTRLTQMDEDLRPENIERSLNGYGTTRTAEMRDTRRRSLESEKKGLESLLAISTQNR